MATKKRTAYLTEVEKDDELEVRHCQVDGCDNPLPEDAPSRREWCDECRSRDKKASGRRVRSGERAKTITLKTLALEICFERIPTINAGRPKIRRDCLTQEAANRLAKTWNTRHLPVVLDNLGDGCNSQRPCPWISCQHHLYVDVNQKSGSLKLNFPDRGVWKMKETCALDVADRGGITLEEAGEMMNITREGAWNLELGGLLKLAEKKTGLA